METIHLQIFVPAAQLGDTIHNVGIISIHFFVIKHNKISHSEAVMKELETLVSCLSEKTERGMLIGLLPRIYSSHLELSKAIGVNERMKKYCQQKGVEFLDLWNVFIGKEHLFKYDGIHLNTLGNIKLGEILSKKCESFSSKMGLVIEPNFLPGLERPENEEKADSSSLGFL